MDQTSEQLNELKKILIDWWILENRNDCDWLKYEKRHVQNERIKTEALKMLLSEELLDLMADKREMNVWWIFQYFITPTSVSSHEVQCSLVQSCKSMSARLNESRDNSWNIHRMLCLAVKWMLKFMIKMEMQWENVWSDQTRDYLFVYLEKVVHICDDIGTVKWTILLIENLCRTMQLSPERKDRLRTALTRYSKHLESDTIDLIKNLNSERYQVEWCARWCCDNILGKGTVFLEIPSIKLSSDRLEARCDFITTKDIYSSVRSPFPVTSNVYFYEVTLVTNGDIRIGWSNEKTILNTLNGIGDDQYSIGLRVGNQCYIRYNKKWNSIRTKVVSLHGNPLIFPVKVIGCLIDVQNQRFEFYINGQTVKCPEGVQFCSSPYYATASLTNHQQCYFNFGQKAFKYPPQNTKFTTFLEASSGDVTKCQLGQTPEYNGLHWFKHSIVDNQIDPFYQDQKQNDYNKLVALVELDIQQKQTPEPDCTKLECARLIQSFIEIMQTKLPCDRIYIFTDMIEQTLTSINGDKTLNYKIIQLLEQLHLYMQISPSTTSNAIKCHNISTISLALFSSEQFHFSPAQHYQFLSRVIRPKTFITDPLLMLYLFDCLEKSPKRNQQSFLSNISIACVIHWWAELFGQLSPLSRLYELSPGDLQRLQIGLSASWLRDQVLECKGFEHSSQQATLNPNDRTQHLKLSADCFTVRSDHKKWQSIRSVCSANSSTFYYEAILFTDGAMRIGWATKDTDLSAQPIGDDNFSVAFDGNSQCVMNNASELTKDKNPISVDMKSRWSPGNVVGCMIDFNKFKFTFYLNGKKLKYFSRNLITFFNVPYYAAISLSTKQQCYINFGQAPFKYQPKGSALALGSLHSKMKISTNQTSLSLCYPVVEVLANEHMDLVFNDSKQKQTERKVEQIERDILDCKVVNVDLSNTNEEESLRLIQGTIQVGGINLRNKLDLLASWIGQIIHESTNQHIHFPELACQVLCPFLGIHLTSDTQILHRNVCIVLSSLVTEIDNLKEQFNLYKAILKYLIEIVTKSDEFNDEWLLMFAIICLEYLELDEEEKSLIRQNIKFCSIVDPSKHVDIISTHVQPQFELCIQWFFNQIFNAKQLQLLPTSEYDTLNPLDRTSHLKLSTDLLTARSDRHWQSIRSVCSVKKATTVYFEVTLHTNGPMRIGWATKRTILSQTMIGEDENSIAFDGYNQCIWHESKRIKLMKPKNGVIPMWKSGDIVGCLVNVNVRTFSFYLNRKLVYFHSCGYFCDFHRYFAAVSLSPQQQCTFNFGPIELPPRRIEFHTFNSQFLSIRGSLNSLVRLSIGSISNSLVAIGRSKVKTKNSQMLQNNK